MRKASSPRSISRRELLETMGKAAAVTVVAPSFLSAYAPGGDDSVGRGVAPLVVEAGPDRVVIEGGRTYLNAWAGYMKPPWTAEPRQPADPEPANAGPEPVVTWSKVSGPGDVLFGDVNALRTTATVTVPGAYTLQMVADNGTERVRSTFDLTGRASASCRSPGPGFHDRVSHRQPAVGAEGQGPHRQLDSPPDRRDRTG